MKDINATGPSRRRVLQAALALAAVPATVRIARAQSRPVTTVQGFKTGADIAKAEQEGEVVYYSHDGEPGRRRSCEAFIEGLPEDQGLAICGLRPARCSTRCSSERSAGRFDVGRDPVLRDAHRGRLPEARRLRALRLAAGREAYAGSSLSPTPGDYFWSGVTFAGIGYNTDRVPDGGCAEDLEGPARSALAQRHQHQAGDVGHAVHRMVRVPAAVRRRVLEGVRQAAPARLRLPRAVVRPARPRVTTRSARWPSARATRSTRRRTRRSSSWRRRMGCPATPAWPASSARPRIRRRRKLFIDWLMSPRGQEVHQQNPYLYLSAPCARMRRRCRAASSCRDFKLLRPGHERLPGQPPGIHQAVERDARPVGDRMSATAALAPSTPGSARPELDRRRGGGDRRRRRPLSGVLSCCRRRSTSATRTCGRRRRTGSTTSPARRTTGRSCSTPWSSHSRRR